MIRAFFWLLLLSVSFNMTACGNRGKLHLPDKRPSTSIEKDSMPNPSEGLVHTP